MKPFRVGHASHPDWRLATDKALEALGTFAPEPHSQTLGVAYFTAPLAPHSESIFHLLRSRTGVHDWVGTCGEAILATGIEYSEEPAIAIMVADLPQGSFHVFSGTRPVPPLRTPPPHTCHTALVHADPQTPDLPDLVSDMAGKIGGGMLFGGISSGRVSPLPQWADDVLAGGLSGVVLTPQVPVRARVTQGCTALAHEHVISDCQANLIRSLDGLPALDVLLADLGVDALTRSTNDNQALLRALPMERIRAGLMLGLRHNATPRRGPQRGLADYLIRDLIGIDPQNRLLAIAAVPSEGDRAVFCTRDPAAARADLIRVCTELRDDIETEHLQALGAIYISCVARGRDLFGTLGAEAALIQAHLGDIPLVGFFANGEISGDQIYGYSGVLAVFTST